MRDAPANVIFVVEVGDLTIPILTWKINYSFKSFELNVTSLICNVWSHNTWTNYLIPCYDTCLYCCGGMFFHGKRYSAWGIISIEYILIVFNIDGSIFEGKLMKYFLSFLHPKYFFVEIDHWRRPTLTCCIDERKWEGEPMMEITATASPFQMCSFVRFWSYTNIDLSDCNYEWRIRILIWIELYTRDLTLSITFSAQLTMSKTVGI